MLENGLVGFAQLDEAILRLLSGVLVRVILQRQCVKAFAHLVQRLLRRDAEQVAGLLVLRLDSPILRVVLEGTVLLPRGVERRREVEPAEEGARKASRTLPIPSAPHGSEPTEQGPPPWPDTPSDRSRPCCIPSAARSTRLAVAARHARRRPSQQPHSNPLFDHSSLSCPPHASLKCCCLNRLVARSVNKSLLTFSPI